MATKGTALATGGVPEDKDTAAAKKTYAPLMTAGTKALGKIRDVEKDIATAESDIAQAKYEQEKTRLKRTEEEEKKYADTTRGLYERAETQEQNYPFPTFKPTQEDATSYAQLGSMVITLGMMLGGGAKASGKSALASMTGMINGWREGRQDLWRREAQQFDKDMQRIKSEREAIQKNLEKGLKLAATDRKAAQASIDAAAHLAGEGVVKEMLKKGQLIPALNYMKQSAALEQKINESIIGMAAAERRNRQQLAAQEAQRQATLKAAEIRAAAKTGAGLLKPGAEVTKNYLGQNALSNDMKDIANNLKDPKFRKLIDDYRIESFASEEMWKLVAQIANDQIPSELRKFLTKVRSVRNNVYLITSGKAVTGGEALRNYGVVAQPGDSAAFMADKVDSMINQIDRTIGQYQKLYGLPAIDAESIKQFRSAEKDGAFDVRQLPVEDQQENIGQAAKNAFGSYEPDKYDYRRDPQTGRMQRAQKE